jgi:hypothetical protein
VREALLLEKSDSLLFEISDDGAVTVRKAVVFTLDARLVERRVGALGPSDAKDVQAALSRALGC